MSTSIVITQQIESLERQLTAKRQELVLVQLIEDLDRQAADLERQRQLAALELQRCQAQQALAEADALAAKLNPSPSPNQEPDPQPAPGAESVQEPQDALNADTAKLVDNIAKRIRKSDADAIPALIDRVKAEGPSAVRALCASFGLTFNSQYRRQILNLVKKGGTK